MITRSVDDAPAPRIRPAPFTLRSIFANVLTYVLAPHLIFGVFTSLVLTALIVRPFFSRHMFLFLQWWQKLMMEWLCLSTGTKLIVDGREFVVPHRSYILVVNHQSWLDTAAVVFAFKYQLNISFLAKASLFAIPIFGRYMRWARFVPISRTREATKNRRRLTQAAGGLIDGQSLLVFAEGTRGVLDEVGAFRTGAFHLSVESGKPILPIVVVGTGRLMPRGTPFFRSGKVRVIALEPVVVEKGGNPAETMQKIRDRMAVAYAGARELERDYAPEQAPEHAPEHGAQTRPTQ